MGPGAPSRRALLGGAAALAAAGCATAATRSSSPDGLDALVAGALADGGTGILVARDGEVLAEGYAPRRGADRPREVASVAKSVIAVLIGMAVEDGAFSGLDQPAADFIPQWRDDGRSGVTLRHLMSMTSGLDDTGLALRGVAGDQFAINAAAPLRDPPGSRWAYNTAAYHLLFHLLARAVDAPVEGWAERRLLGPLGMTHTRWLTSPGAGARGPVTNYYSAASTARDLARFGEMILGGGVWNGRRLIGAAMLESLLAPSQELNPSYGLLWWTNARPGKDAWGRGDSRRFPSAPHDTVAALGAGGQALLLVPSRTLIVVRQGDPPGSADFADDLLATALRLQ